jgi:hypothetical protein
MIGNYPVRQPPARAAIHARNHTAPQDPYYGEPVPWDAISAIGSVLGGLAIVLAFVQLGSQRRDGLRAQISLIGAWYHIEDARMVPDQPAWQIALFIRNASKLPVDVTFAELAIDTLGYKNVLASAGGEPPQLYADKRTGPTTPARFFPRIIRPGQTWRGEHKYAPDGDFDTVKEPRINFVKISITDAAGRQWDIRPYSGRPPRRVHWRREWPWRHGRLPPPGPGSVTPD